MHPIVPFIDVPGAPPLGITSSCIGFGCMVTQVCLTVLRGVAHIGSMGVAVILNFPPGWFVALCWVVVVDRIANVP